jgi:gliding motility associated protien GldN
MVYPNDSMTNPMTPSDIRQKVNYETTIQVQVDPNDPYNVIDSTVQVNFDWESIKRYKIMEEWFFDKKHSLFFGRIIYIAPMYQPYAGGLQAPEQPMCYIRYHDNTLNDSFTFRHVAVNEEMFNRDNDAQRITFDDWFEMRMFSSYIIKESNPWDFKIKEMDEYKDSPVDALLESDRIKNMLFEKEHDLWEY